MGSYAYMVLATPREGVEDEYNEWQKTVHAYKVLDVPGFVSGQRFRLADLPSNRKDANWVYLSVYEMETDDPGAAIAELGSRYGTPRMPKSDLSDPSKTVSYVWELVSEHVAPKK